MAFKHSIKAGLSLGLVWHLISSAWAVFRQPQAIRPVCYNVKSISKILGWVKVNAGDLSMKWYSDEIPFNFLSPVENNEHYFMLTQNSGRMNLQRNGKLSFNKNLIMLRNLVNNENTRYSLLS